MGGSARQGRGLSTNLRCGESPASKDHASASLVARAGDCPTSEHVEANQFSFFPVYETQLHANPVGQMSNYSICTSARVENSFIFKANTLF